MVCARQPTRTTRPVTDHTPFNWVWRRPSFTFQDEPDDIEERFTKVADELYGVDQLVPHDFTERNYSYSDGWEIQGRLLVSGVIVLYRPFKEIEPGRMARWRYVTGHLG